MDTPIKFLKSLSIRILIILDIIVLLILIAFYLSPTLVENIYSKGIYPFFANVFGFITDLVVFSITELVIVVAVIVILIRIFFGIYRSAKKHRTFKNVFMHFLKQLFVLVSIIFIWFYLLWGFNYFRQPIESKVSSLSVKKEVDETLFPTVMNFIIDKTNTLYISSISRNNYNYPDINEAVSEAVDLTVKEIDNIDIKPAKRMKISLSHLLEVSNTLGVISPFFIEAHFSKELIDAELPFIMAHEKTHLYGYANETEANYIAFLACINSKNKYLQYSAYSQILRYFLSQYQSECRNIYGEEWKEEYEKVLLKVRKEVRDEYLQQKERFEKYENFISKGIRSIYNIYLKINNVKGGIKAYSRVVTLILRSEIMEKLTENWDESGMIEDYDEYLRNRREEAFQKKKLGDDEYDYTEDIELDIDEDEFP